MAYQNVGTPRFYVNVIEFLASTGLEISDKFRTLPVNPSYVNSVTVPSESHVLLTDDMDKFIFVLGHNMVSGSQIVMTGGLYDESTINVLPVTYNGFSLLKYKGDLTTISVDADIGSFVIGNTYTMPNAPNLSLTMSREYGGTKEFTTYNGSSMSNTMWSKAPKWGDLGAWELDSGNAALSRSGRRAWDLKFSFMDDGDLWGSIQLLDQTPYTYAQGGGSGGSALTEAGWDSDDIDDNDSFAYNLLTDDNFFSQVWHKTLGGTLPFIFQPDSSNNSPDHFCIAKFKDSSLKATQSAFNVYDISLSIEEVW